MGMEKAADFELKDLTGKTYKLSDFKGKVVILDFWATWCPPCIKSVPFFKEIYDKYRDKGLVVIGISVDISAGTVSRFVKDRKINYIVLMDRDNIVSDMYKVFSIPTTFIIDPDGYIVIRRSGFSNEHAQIFENTVKRLLKETGEKCQSAPC